MAGFESTLRASAKAILKRDLTESEIVEFLGLSEAIGMSNVEDYLYMLMVFKRNEDKVNKVMDGFSERMTVRFDEMSNIERKINDTLESSISRVLGDGAREISRDMGKQIADSAKGVLSSTEEFHFIRGQTFSATLVIILSVVSYWLGAIYGFGSEENPGFLSRLLYIPAGYVIFFGGFTYTTLWCFDYWKPLKESTMLKVKLGLQILVLGVLFLRLL